MEYCPDVAALNTVCAQDPATFALSAVKLVWSGEFSHNA